MAKAVSNHPVDEFEITDIELLQQLCPLVRDAAFPSVRSHDRVPAKTASADAQAVIHDAFPAEVVADLLYFEAAIQNSSRLATANLLAVFKDHFITSSKDDSTEYEPYNSHPYRNLCAFLYHFHRLEQSKSHQDKGDWLRQRVTVHALSEESRKLVIDRFKDIRKILEDAGSATVPRRRTRNPAPLPTEWHPARAFCLQADIFHETLKTGWRCTCHPSHKPAKFSFRRPYQGSYGSSDISVFSPCTSPLGRDRSEPWQGADLRFEGQELPLQHDLDPEESSHSIGSDVAHDSDSEPEEAWSGQFSLFGYQFSFNWIFIVWQWMLSIGQSRPAKNDSVNGSLRRPKSPKGGRMQLCMSLDSARDGLRIDVRACASGFELSHHDENSANTHGSRRLRIPMSLEAVLNEAPLRRDNWLDQSRLELALILSYAYLHLSGGPWLPYNRDLSKNIWLFQANGLRSYTVDHPFFTSSLSGSESVDQTSMGVFNPDMPSLPAFGKLILELAVGRALDWKEFEVVKENVEGRIYAHEIIHAVDTCMQLNGQGTIRDNSNTKNKFLQNVVLRLQDILERGLQTSPEEIFGEVRGPQRQQSREERVEERLRLNLAAFPSAAVNPDQRGSCLREDGQIDKLDSKKLNRALEFTQSMSAWVDSALDFDFLPDRFALETSRNRGPLVKIAVLDTGACLERVAIDQIYDGRLKEVRSWRPKPSSRSIFNWEEGESIPLHSNGDLVGEDEDGHGTHTTSLLLNSTQNTDFDVFVAKVFANRAEDQENREIQVEIENGIANAIIYAVDRWDVDIITMSFGFEKPVESIRRAIKYAQEKTVLMLASASNSGGIRETAWPAKDDRVIAIYATDGHGNKYPSNPTPRSHTPNFSILGECVRGLKPCSPCEEIFRSGTSCAAPIAAALTAVLIGVLKHCQGRYIDHVSARRRQIVAKDYERHLENERDGYYFICPWKIKQFNFREVDYSANLIAAILDELDRE